MKTYDSFVNQYDISKTLRFALIPMGKTEENFENACILQEDEKRAADSIKVKEYMDRYHKYFIESVLNTVKLDGLEDYAELYYLKEKDDNARKNIEKLEADLRKQISKSFKSDERYSKLFKADIIKSILPDFLTDDEEKTITESFCQFTTYFTGFFTNRENMYSENDEATSISHRCINDNLPKFLDNAKNFEKIKAAIGDDIKKLNGDFEKTIFGSIDDLFTVDYFTMVLSQSAIDLYNRVIGGYSLEDGTKIKGVNEYINLYNQKHEKSQRLPLMKMLYKQILSDREHISFLPEKFENDNEVIKAVNSFYGEIKDSLAKFEDLFNSLSEYNQSGIYLKSDAVTALSNALFGDWNAVNCAWEQEYKEQHPLKNIKQQEKYDEKMKAEYKKIKSFSLAKIQQLVESCSDVCKNAALYIENTVKELCGNVQNRYSLAEGLLTNEYAYKRRLSQNDDAIALIKDLLDSIKDLERFIKPLCGTGKEEEKDDLFYGKFLPLYDELTGIDKLYDKVRNYVTAKPYSTDKIKLNFQNPQLLGGWDKNKEKDYLSVILRKDGYYYLAIMNKKNNTVFLEQTYQNGESCYEKLEYKLLPGPNKMLPKVFFANSNIEYFAPSPKIISIKEKETFKKGDKFNIDDCRELIDFYKKSIKKHPDWSKFGFKFKATEEYNDIGEFYNDVKEQGYSVKFVNISEEYINALVDEGKIYLFKIYNKDFSPSSKGTPNLHTLYFNNIFSEENLSDVVYKLNGEAEMFYRKASIKEEEKTVHYANVPIDNKNPNSPNKTSVFKYDIVKDKRFTKRQFLLHVPITVNFKAAGNNVINYKVRDVLKNAEEQYIIGIDRGERNLIYVCVINQKGEIVEQHSLNEITHGKNNLTTDYHAKLDKREDERAKARQNWTTIKGIKELKEGYLSLVVHEICTLAVKYNAVIALEDLNQGFKNSRIKVEKQVYQKFETMLINKLSLLIDKNTSVNENGGAMKAYQLVNKPDGKAKGRQNGFIFYVNPYLTSKIDPTTGFVDLIKPKYKSVREAKELISSFDCIKYNADNDYFEFTFKYSSFFKSCISYVDEWTVCTNSDRIRTYRNHENRWESERVVLTDKFKELFAEYGVDISTSNMKESLLKADDKFYEKFIRLLALTLQMRNSVPNTDEDYLISPVKNHCGTFYDSRTANEKMPENADANGAYNIARKALWAIMQLKNADDVQKVNLSISKDEWLKFAQE